MLRIQSACLAIVLVGLPSIACDSSVAARAADGEPKVSQPMQDATELAVEPQRVRLSKPFTYRRNGETLATDEVVEFRVSSKHAFEARARDPVLLVGSEPITDYRYGGANVLVFVAPAPKRLERGAPVFFQWGLEPAPGEKIRTAYVYRPDEMRVLDR